MDWYVYIVRCGDGSLYTGMTYDIERRIIEHNAGRGARYTRARLPVDLIAAWRVDDKSAALTMEAAIKRLGRTAKLRLVNDEATLVGPVAGAERVA